MRLKTFQLSNYTRMIPCSRPQLSSGTNTTETIRSLCFVRNSIIFELACGSVGMAHASGMISHVRQSLSSVRRIAKCTLKEFVEVSEVLNTALCFFCFPSCCSSLLYSLISPQTSRGSGCILAFCLHFRFWASLLGRSSSLALQIFCHCDVVTMRPLAPLQH